MRRTTIQSLLATALALALSAPSQANEPGPAASAVSPQDLLLAIRAADDEATHAAAARILAAAESGNSFAMYDIGSLHRQSRREQAAEFAYDPGKALQWLTRAFDDGRLTAAYKIALTYASLGDDMEAMGWAQMYSHYLRPSEQESGKPQQLRLALLNDLHARIGRDREDAIEARLMALLDKHGAKFEENRKQDEPRHPDWIVEANGCKRTRRPKGEAVQVRVEGHALVEFLVEIEPNGQVGDFAALDSAPSAMHERDLRPLVHRIACQPGNGAARYTFNVLELRGTRTLALSQD